MATERLPMRHIREILRQKLVLKLSNRKVATSLDISSGAVSGAVTRARALDLDWNKIAALGDDALEERLYGPRSKKRAGRPLPDPAYLHVELRRTGVTLQLLHLEYLEQHPDGFRYTSDHNPSHLTTVQIQALAASLDAIQSAAPQAPRMNGAATSSVNAPAAAH